MSRIEIDVGDDKTSIVLTNNGLWKKMLVEASLTNDGVNKTMEVIEAYHSECISHGYMAMKNGVEDGVHVSIISDQPEDSEIHSVGIDIYKDTTDEQSEPIILTTISHGDVFKRVIRKAAGYKETCWGEGVEKSMEELEGSIKEFSDTFK